MVARAAQIRRRSAPTTVQLAGKLSLVIGIIWMVSHFASSRSEVPKSAPAGTQVVAEYNVVSLPVPERPVPVGMRVRDIAIRYEPYPEHQLPSDVVRDIELFGDRVTAASLPGGLPIIATNLISPNEFTNPVIGRIPPGMRAMTVKVDATSSVEGWARSGSVVDVLLVEKARTTVVAERVQILSTEGSLSAVAERPDGNIPTTVTLLVTQEQCLAINTAIPLGRIAFALRSGRDDDAWRNTRFSAGDLTGGYDRRPSKIGGVARYSVGGREKTMALVDGDWIAADGVPSIERSR